MDKCVLLKDTTQWSRWGLNPRPLGFESSTLPPSHCASWDRLFLRSLQVFWLIALVTDNFSIWIPERRDDSMKACHQNRDWSYRDFPRPDLGPNNGPFPIQNEQKTSQNGVYHSQFLSSTFLVKISWKSDKKIPKLQMHENLHKNHILMQIFMSFFGGQLNQQICYSFTLLIQFQFSEFDGPNAFIPNSTGPWPQLQKGRKIPVLQQSPSVEVNLFDWLSVSSRLVFHICFKTTFAKWLINSMGR